MLLNSPAPPLRLRASDSLHRQGGRIGEYIGRVCREGFIGPSAG
jgi:hypothetical protein